MPVLASLLIDLGLAVGIKNNNTGINLFYMTLASNFLPGDSVKGGNKVSLDRRGNNLKETAADQIHFGPETFQSDQGIHLS